MHLLRGSTKSTDDQSLQFGCWLFRNDPLKSHEASRKIFIGRDGEDQRDFSLKPTRLTPAIDFGHAKEELKKILGKSSWWGSTNAFSQEKKQQPLKGGVISSSWTLALQPISCISLVQPGKLSG